MQRTFEVYFSDTDAAGIMFFGNIYTEAHKSIEHFIKENLNLYDKWFRSEEYIVPIRHSSCEHLRPIFFGHKYCTNIKIREIKESSVIFEIDFLDSKGNACAVVKTIHVFACKTTKKKRPIPEEIKSSLQSQVPPT